jgi:hypothetical protein
MVRRVTRQPLFDKQIMHDAQRNLLNAQPPFWCTMLLHVFAYDLQGGQHFYAL